MNLQQFAFKLFSLVILVLFTISCQKSDSYKELSKIANEKYLEIKALSESRGCGDLDKWQIKTIYYSCWHHFAIHQDDLEKFEKLAVEYLEAQKRADAAKDKPVLFHYSPCEPNPPFKIVCDAGKPKLLHPYEVDHVAVIQAELENRYHDIKNFYADMDCTDPEEWSSRWINVACCYEGIAIHRTINTNEFLELLYIYSSLNWQHNRLTETNCTNAGCKIFFKPVQCIDGKPYVELTD